MTLPTSRELREILDEATPAPWEYERFDMQLVDCPKATQFWVSGEDERDIAGAAVLPEYHDQTEKNFTLIALAPQLAEEVIRLREAIEDEIRSLREPLCSHIPEGDELDEHLEEWEMRSYAVDILTRIIDRPTRIKEVSSE